MDPPPSLITYFNVGIIGFLLGFILVIELGSSLMKSTFMDSSHISLFQLLSYPSDPLKLKQPSMEADFEATKVDLEAERRLQVMKGFFCLLLYFTSEIHNHLWSMFFYTRVTPDRHRYVDIFYCQRHFCVNVLMPQRLDFDFHFNLLSQNVSICGIFPPSVQHPTRGPILQFIGGCHQLGFPHTLNLSHACFKVCLTINSYYFAQLMRALRQKGWNESFFLMGDGRGSGFSLEWFAHSLSKLRWNKWIDSRETCPCL